MSRRTLGLRPVPGTDQQRSFDGLITIYILKPLVHLFHYDQLLAKRKVLGSEIRGDFELRPNEQNKISKYFHHDSNMYLALTFSILLPPVVVLPSILGNSVAKFSSDVIFANYNQDKIPFRTYALILHSSNPPRLYFCTNTCRFPHPPSLSTKYGLKSIYGAFFSSIFKSPFVR
jgi:hypothetical protein